ncbi:hypothetical protein B0H19DRAFT_1190474 [Mycena capillaripes]|nr:hypothetical protein B0H19DRAFT_1190474 [Mycena capillaripes]
MKVSSGGSFKALRKYAVETSFLSIHSANAFCTGFAAAKLWQELVECCLDFLDDSKPDFNACALVCRAWVPIPANPTAMGDVTPPPCTRSTTRHSPPLSRVGLIFGCHQPVHAAERGPYFRIYYPSYGRYCHSGPSQASNSRKCRIVLHVSKPGSIFTDLGRVFSRHPASHLGSPSCKGPQI